MKPPGSSSQDPVSGEPVRITISPRGLKTVEPRDVMLSLVSRVTSATRLIAMACHFSFFFASRESAEHWIAVHPQAGLLTHYEAFAFGSGRTRGCSGQSWRVCGPMHHMVP